VRGLEFLSLEFGYEPLPLRSPTTTLSTHILLKLRFRIRQSILFPLLLFFYFL
jgi:hypothetical protein